MANINAYGLYGSARDLLFCKPRLSFAAQLVKCSSYSYSDNNNTNNCICNELYIYLNLQLPQVKNQKGRK